MLAGKKREITKTIRRMIKEMNQQKALQQFIHVRFDFFDLFHFRIDINWLHSAFGHPIQVRQHEMQLCASTMYENLTCIGLLRFDAFAVFATQHHHNEIFKVHFVGAFVVYSKSVRCTKIQQITTKWCCKACILLSAFRSSIIFISFFFAFSLWRRTQIIDHLFKKKPCKC